MPRVILSLCDFTGTWPAPYRAAGYDVRTVDLAQETAAWVPCRCCDNYWCRVHERHAHECPCPPVEEWDNSPYASGLPGQDVRFLEWIDAPVHGVLAAPPCTVFTKSGARWPRTPEQLAAGLAIVDACLRVVLMHRPVWWALENPVGKLRRWLGPPTMIFHPWQFGDPYAKQTCLWGNFNPPAPLFTGQRPVKPERVCSQGSWVQKLGGKSERTKRLRSATPPGFAQAFFDSNP